MKNEPINVLISTALNMWANWIETEDVTLSAQDAINMKKNNIIQPLTLDQQELVVRLRRLAIEHQF